MFLGAASMIGTTGAGYSGNIPHEFDVLTYTNEDLKEDFVSEKVDKLFDNNKISPIRRLPWLNFQFMHNKFIKLL